MGYRSTLTKFVELSRTIDTTYSLPFPDIHPPTARRPVKTVKDGDNYSKKIMRRRFGLWLVLLYNGLGNGSCSSCATIASIY